MFKTGTKFNNNKLNYNLALFWKGSKDNILYY